MTQPFRKTCHNLCFFFLISFIRAELHTPIRNWTSSSLRGPQWARAEPTWARGVLRSGRYGESDENRGVWSGPRNQFSTLKIKNYLQERDGLIACWKLAASCGDCSPAGSLVSLINLREGQSTYDWDYQDLFLQAQTLLFKWCSWSGSCYCDSVDVVQWLWYKEMPLR